MLYRLALTGSRLFLGLIFLTAVLFAFALFAWSAWCDRRHMAS